MLWEVDMRSSRAIAAGGLVLLLTALTACGGGGTGSSGGTTPSTATFTIRGSIVGLTGTLTLRHNSADDLLVDKDGPFTFTGSLPAGSPYTVTVVNQPQGERCSVAHGSGTTGSSNVIDVAVTCQTMQVGASGAPDSTFSADGKVTTDFSGAPSI